MLLLGYGRRGCWVRGMWGESYRESWYCWVKMGAVSGEVGVYKRDSWRYYGRLGI